MTHMMIGICIFYKISLLNNPIHTLFIKVLFCFVISANWKASKSSDNCLNSHRCNRCLVVQRSKSLFLAHFSQNTVIIVTFLIIQIVYKTIRPLSCNDISLNLRNMLFYMWNRIYVLLKVHIQNHLFKSFPGRLKFA